MAAIKFYKNGSRWVVAGNTVDEGTCMVSETDNGLSVSIKFLTTLTPLAYGAYTDFVDSEGTAYTKAQMLLLINQFTTKQTGVCDACVDAVLSDTVDLSVSGYFQPRLLGGDIKVTDVDGNESVLTFDLGEISLFRARRIWSTGTTADMGIKIYY